MPKKTDVEFQRRMRDTLFSRQGVPLTDVAINKQPSIFFASINIDNRRQQILDQISFSVRARGETLPNGKNLPPERDIDVSYWIKFGNSLIFQQGDSPFAEGGTLTPANVDAAMNAHVEEIVDEVLATELSEEYLDSVTL